MFVRARFSRSAPTRQTASNTRRVAARPAPRTTLRVAVPKPVFAAKPAPMFSVSTAKRMFSTANNSASWWSKVTMGPPDPILGVSVAFQKSTHPKKMNLGVGAYRDDNNKPFILNAVRKAEQKIHQANMNHEYAGISGVPEFNTVSQNLIFGDNSQIVANKQVVTAQALSGTGALRLGTEFLARFLESKEIYMPEPTWGNHIPLAQDSGLTVKKYRYYNPKTCGLDEENLLNDLKAVPKGSIVLLHACAHNPTGVDPSQEQWKKISNICKEKGLFVFFDAAYQGFASGDPERDVWAIRYFIEQGHKPIIAQSFAKNFGLYGERIGTIHIVTNSAEESERVDSQLKILIRPMYSNPPIYGARVIATILQDPELKAEWRREVKVMADRIITMRKLLVQHLKELGSKKDWSHVTNQIGMFCFTGLTPEQVDRLTNEYAIFLTRNGRISVAGLTSSNVKYLAEAIHAVTK